MENSFILIQGAMDIEVVNYLDKMVDKKNIQIEGFDFYQGTIGNKKVIISKTFAESANITLATYIACMNFNISLIINQGTMGGYKNFVHVNDIIVASKLINKNHCKMNIDYENNIPYMKYTRFSDEGVEGGLNFKEIDMDKYYIEKTKNIPYKNGKVYYGPIATGDIWIDDKMTIEMLQREYNIYGEEMEAYFVAAIGKNKNVPVIVIRVVSNNLITDEEYCEDVVVNLTDYICDYIQVL